MKIKLLLLFTFIVCCTFIAHAQVAAFSQRLDTNFTIEVVKIANPLKYDVLCISQDCTVYNPSNNAFGPVKGSFGTAWYLPGGFSTSGESAGTVYVTHTTNEKNAALGDGGGIIKFKVERGTDAKWKVVPSARVAGRNVYYVNVDMSGIGGSIGNGDIIIDKYTQNDQTFLVSESMIQNSNAELGTGVTDLSDYTVPNYLTQGSNPFYVVPGNTKLKRYQQMNWMVQVDAATGAPRQKIYPLGRFNHAYCINALGGYFMTTGRTPSVLLKWVPNDPTNLQIGGELFAYKQNPGSFDEFISLNKHKTLPDGTDSTWQDFDSLLVVEEQALRAGATMFANLSGLATDNIEGIDVLYIAERGIDNSADAFTNKAKKYNGVLASHLSEMDAADGQADGVVHDYNGRILALTADGNMQVLLEGGASTDRKYYFSNPESISLINGPQSAASLFEKYFIIKENINGIDNGRNPAHVSGLDKKINEVYSIKAPIQMDYTQAMGIPTPVKPVLDSLKLFMIGPKGSVVTGGNSYDVTLSSEKNNTYFVSISNPNSDNPSPNNQSMVIAVRDIWGEKKTTVAVMEPVFKNTSSFQIWPNPAAGILHFNKTTDIGIYNSSGILMKVHRNVASIEVNDLLPGMYFIKNAENETQKLIIE